MPASYRAYFGVPAVPPWHGQLHVAPLADRPHRNRNVTQGARLDLMSMRYHAVRKSSPPELWRAVHEFAGGPSHLFQTMALVERSDAVPRAYTVRRITRVPDLEAALRRLDEESFRPLAEAVVVAQPGALPALTSNAPPGEQDRARIAAYEPNEVIIEAECRAACLLVLTDLHYPGWSARLDRASVAVESAFGVWRKVRVDAGGPLRLDFRYAPRSFLTGAWLSVLSLLTLVLFATRKIKI